MNNIKVSVIIPVYQVKNYLERAIDSVVRQTLKEIEIILVDDGSDDGSEIICDEYVKKYSEFIKVIHKENEGLGLARNSGVEISTGEYIAFIDSDDFIEPTMYEEMYIKAIEANYDIVMSDMKIHYVETGKEITIATYSSSNIDLADYLMRGENITYSVNKLFKREIFIKNKYEKMLFEDIALVPSLIVKYPHIGYVPKSFYTYCRRENSLSTTFEGQMSDVVKAYRMVIDRSNVTYREEVIYYVAKHILWNMTKSRVIFKADFINLLQDYKKDFLLNSYIKKDNNTKKIIQFMDTDIIPNNIICVDLDDRITEQYMDSVITNFSDSNVIIADKDYFDKRELPNCVVEALGTGKNEFVEEYFALRILYEKGGIVIQKNMLPTLNLRGLRINKVFWGFGSYEDIVSGCYGALKNHYVIEALLDTYSTDNIYNRAYLPIAERVRDYLLVQFKLRLSGRTQLLGKEVQIYAPNILAYDMKDGNNCCKIYFHEAPLGYEIVSKEVLEFWSNKIIDNWHLYKKEKEKNNLPPKKSPPVPENKKTPLPDYKKNDDLKIKEVIDTYENSTCWKITKPIRIIAGLFEKRNKPENEGGLL